MDFTKPYNRMEWLEFLQTKFMPDDFDIKLEENILLEHKFQFIKNVNYLGVSESLGVKIYEVHHKSANDPRISLTRESFKLVSSYGESRALVLFTSQRDIQYRFSLITIQLNIQDGKVKEEISNPKRYSFILGEDTKIHTPQEYLVKKGRVLDFNDLQNRFSVEIVNKEFYNNIAELFTELVGGVRKVGRQTKDFEPLLKLPDTTNHIKMQEFAVRLIGRIVFCWFLKKKKSTNGIPLIPDEVLSVKAIKDNYYHTILEPLFFEVMNTPIDERKESISQNVLFKNIPFLNGGLFDPNLHQDYYKYFPMEKEYKPAYNLKIPDDWFVKFFSVLELYNFTIDENTSIDIDLSVDPEMLGRIFENLLAEINPETQKTARKATGSYYTPRPIVEYMVDESLVQYLLTNLESFSEENPPDKGEQKGVNNLEQNIRNLLDYSIEENELTKDESQKVIDALDKIKILDPACGSGAFPMGILQKMILIRQKVDPESIEWVIKQLEMIPDILVRKALEDELMDENWDYKYKMSAIIHSIYGVDIQPIAVELSKLRFFLTLMVDETVNDDKPNRGINELPNLSFKFVAANTLIGLPEAGKDEQMDLMDFDNLLDPMMNKLEILREKFFYASGKEKDRIEKEFKYTQTEIGQFLGKEGSTNKRAVALANWNPFADKSSDWFDPKWMFGMKDGFDIVIGNPPYIKEYTDRHAFDGFREKSPYYQGKMDIWYGFVCISVDLLKTSGNLCFIASNNWITNYGASIMRNKVINETQIKKILDFYCYMIFECSDIQTMVMLFQKDYNFDNYEFDYRKLKGNNLTISSVNDLLQKTKSEDTVFFSPKIEKKKYLNTFFVFNKPEIENILQKMLNIENIKLSDNEVAQGIVFPQDFLNKKNQKILGNGFNVGDGIFALSKIEKESLNLSNKEKELIKPYYTTEELHRYYGSNKNKYWLIYTSSEFRKPYKIKPYPNIKNHLDKFRKVITSDFKPYGLHRTRKEKFFKGEKIIALRKCSKEPIFTYTDFDCYVSATFYVIKTERTNIKFLTGFLNSKLCAFWLRYKGKMQGNNFQIDKEPLLNISIPKITEANQQPFIILVDQILNITKAEDYLENTEKQAKVKDLEKKIDKLVYELYGLIEEEIRLVEGL